MQASKVGWLGLTGRYRCRGLLESTVDGLNAAFNVTFLQDLNDVILGEERVGRLPCLREGGREREMA